MSTAPVPVAVVGAGPAGLAVAACVQRAGLPCTVLEQQGSVGSSWRGHYRRLHLHTDKAHSALPLLGFPVHYPRYPSRQQVVDYLAHYTEHFGIRPRFNERVVRARREGPAWRIDTTKGIVHASNLVVATGVNREPQRPQWPGQDSFPGPIVHSADYRDGVPYAGLRVLVVGLGNSGGEIAIDLWEHGAKPCIAVRSPVNVIPREVLGVPFLTMGILQQRLPPRLADALNAPVTRLLVGDLTGLGLRKPAQGPITQIHETGRVPFIDVGTIDLIRQGAVGVRPGIERFEGQEVVFTDGRREAFDAVVLATGYRPNVASWLQADEEDLQPTGLARRSGKALNTPGLYLCGFYISPTGMLREIAREAQAIARVLTSSSS